MHSELTTLFGYLTDMNLYQFYSMVFNQIFPFGLLFWGVGLIIFTTIYMKTDNTAYAGGLLCVYMLVISESGFITNIYSATAMRYVGLILAVVVGWNIYKAIRDR